MKAVIFFFAVLALAWGGEQLVKLNRRGFDQRSAFDALVPCSGFVGIFLYYTLVGMLGGEKTHMHRYIVLYSGLH